MTTFDEVLKSFQHEMNFKDKEIEQLQESFQQIALKIDEIGWELQSDLQSSSSGPSLDELHSFSNNIRQLTAQNPLLKRGCELRGNYVFGNGVEFRDVKAAAERLMEKNHNKRVLFSPQGWEELNRAKYTDGNVFVLYNKKTMSVSRVPIVQITGVVTNPDDAEEVWWLQRTWTNSAGTHIKWYRTIDLPDAQKNRRKIEQTEGKVASPDEIMFLETANKQVGWTFGVPDALAAVLWAMAYSAYLNDNSTLVKAYSRFAMRITSASVKGHQNAAAEVRTRNPNGVAQTAITPVGTDLTAMPATGSQVNFNNGQPLAAMVAASLGVSVIALISSPGAAGGSYGAAATLDAPTIIGMSAIQDTWANFFQTFLKNAGSKDVKVEFPAIETDPTYRILGQLPMLIDAGIIHRDEARSVVIDLMDIRDPKSSLPKIEKPQPQTQPAPTKPNIEQGDTNNDGRTDVISK